MGDAAEWVAEHLDDLYCGELDQSGTFPGGQTAADRALATFDVAGYAARRNEVLPLQRRGASGLSPYIRHGLLPLPRVWAEVAGGPDRDVAKFRDELLWQEYARHMYARLGSRNAEPLRSRRLVESSGDPWDTDMACVTTTLRELETDGWLVNQTRMWLASHWSVRHGAPWRAGEDRFFRHLVDGSRAANRLGWQWTAGFGTGRPYGFSRHQVERRAPGLCATCPYDAECPIADWPDNPPLEPVDRDPRLTADSDLAATAGPSAPGQLSDPEAVWVTAESLGDDDPALAAHPELPAVFVFDEPLLRRLQLSAKRLVFLTESLADLAERRPVEVQRGAPSEVLAGCAVATTFTPVPGWRRIAADVRPVAVHPWPWLRQPHAGSLASFSAWRKAL
ncbi:MAG: deoxyribodipyrimidine photolyase [Acidimicrobiia bacterium]|nr:deoxyribodipyrimidine photolyase [Acidimicrobiia bacterium]